MLHTQENSWKAWGQPSLQLPPGFVIPAKINVIRTSTNSFYFSGWSWTRHLTSLSRLPFPSLENEGERVELGDPQGLSGAPWGKQAPDITRLHQGTQKPRLGSKHWALRDDLRKREGSRSSQDTGGTHSNSKSVPDVRESEVVPCLVSIYLTILGT